MATTAQRDKTRLYIGDTNADRPLFNDNEIDLVIDDQGSQNARTKLTRSQMSKAYSDRAVALRRRANGQVSTASTTRVDGFNEDVDSRSGAGQASPANGRVRVGYTNPDLPV
jgi:hypothetical protein